MSGTFPPDVISAAQSSDAKWRCPASVCLAQWALESAWGTKMSGKNNPFGIKATAGQAGTSVQTHEVIKGATVSTVAVFRDFASLAEAFDAHGALLATGSAYAPARAALPNAKAFANALTGHYATDPEYGSKLIQIMDAHNLYTLDVQTAAPVKIPAPAPPKSSAAAKAAAGATVVVAGSVAATVPHGHPLMWVLGGVAVLGLALFLLLHFRKA